MRQQQGVVLLLLAARRRAGLRPLHVPLPDLAQCRMDMMDTLRGADAYLVLAMIRAAQEGRAQAVVGVTSGFKEQARESLWLYLSCPIRHAAAVASGAVVDEGKRATTLALLRRQLQGSGLTGDAVLRGCARAFGDWLACAEPGTHLAQQLPPPPPLPGQGSLPSTAPAGSPGRRVLHAPGQWRLAQRAAWSCSWPPPPVQTMRAWCSLPTPWPCRS